MWNTFTHSVTFHVKHTYLFLCFTWNTVIHLLMFHVEHKYSIAQ